MKYIIKEKKCTIILDDCRDNKAIELTLRGVALILSGIDDNDDWELFNALMKQVNDRLIQACNE